MSVTTTSTTMAPEECFKCHVLFLVPQAFQQDCVDLGRSFWCPNGHQQVYAETETTKARKAAAAARKDADMAWERFRQERAAHDHEKRSHAATRGHLTRMRNRIAAGMCPYCRRPIKQLREHVGARHPEKATEYAVLAAEARQPKAVS